MADLKLSRDLALQTLKNPPPVASKLAALDALDRLALNPSGWLSDSVLDQLTEGRKAIITVDHFLSGRLYSGYENRRLHPRPRIQRCRTFGTQDEKIPQPTLFGRVAGVPAPP